MIDPIELGREFFEGLMAIDKAIVEQAGEQPCGDCGGPLHRSDYPRKPREGLLAMLAEGFERRFSRQVHIAPRQQPAADGRLPDSRNDYLALGPIDFGHAAQRMGRNVFGRGQFRRGVRWCRCARKIPRLRVGLEQGQSGLAADLTRPGDRAGGR